MRKEIIGYLGEDWSRVQNLIQASLSSDIELLNQTNDSILENGGKQLRPLLALLVARAVGGAVTEDCVRMAAASELLHNATLLHDDVADGSSERRGRPTVMSLLGSRAAVLLGDYWLVKAMDNILASSVSDSVMGLFSKTLSDLAVGEMLQLQKAVKGDTTESDYIRIIYSKTASLFETACTSSAISARASQEVVEAIRRYAVSLGIAFQIKDDILDYAGTQIGKPVGVDIREQKITLPLLGAFAASTEQEVQHAREMMREVETHPQFCEDLMEYVKQKGGIRYAETRLDEYVNEAIEALSVLEDSQAKKYLVLLAKYTANRNR